jgi:hypothetical protein
MICYGGFSLSTIAEAFFCIWPLLVQPWLSYIPNDGAPSQFCIEIFQGKLYD